MDFAALRAKAEAAASSARQSIPGPSKPSQRYEPVRPALGASTKFPSQAEQRQQSTVLQLDASRRVLPPPPRRLSAQDAPVDAPAGPPPSYAAAPPPVAAKARPPPPPARKPSGLAPPPAPPPRAAKPPALASPASSSSAVTRPPPSSVSTSRPILAPPYDHAVSHDLPALAASSPSPALAARFPAPRAVLTPTSSAPAHKRFTEYDERDKEDLFAALDSFFGSRIEVTTVSYTAEEEEKEPTEPAPYLPPSPAPAPPPVATSSRPRLPATASSLSSPPVSPAFAPTPKPPKPPELHAPSYPPPESHSSAALSILHYILSHPFATPWFVHSPHSTSSPLPPPLVGRSDLRFTASWSQRNSDKQHVGAALFGDGSVAWWGLSWTAEAEAAGRAHLDARREGRYRPRPDVASWDAHALYAQSEALGTRVARFAEEAVERGVPVARGECWDMASEALSAAAAEVAKEDKPFPSIGRTHGALLFHARAGRDGTWTGGDAYVRPGDVVEWREVRISEVGARRGQYMVLGDPDHTAVILSAAPPSAPPILPDSPPYRDSTYPLASLSAITVAEQSLGQAPSIRTYDLATLSQGEVWIYRPCALKALCGIDEVEARWPEDSGVECWSVGELE